MQFSEVTPKTDYLDSYTLR